LVGVLRDKDLPLAERFDNLLGHLAISKNLPDLLKTKILAVYLGVPGGVEEED
jgi:hypothetical protein